MKNILKSGLLIISLIFSSVAVAGVEGTYNLDMEVLLENAAKMPQIAPLPDEQKQMALKTFEAFVMTLNLKDGHYNVQMTMMGQNQSAKGTYVLGEGKVTMTNTHDNGKPVTAPETADLIISGTDLIMSAPGMPFPFVLNKSE